MARDSDTLIEIDQPSGRRLWCWKYVLAYSYEGYLERTPSEDCNQQMLSMVRREADRYFGDGWPIHIIQPIRVTAFFTSMPMIPDMHLSSLVAFWFQHGKHPLPTPPREPRWKRSIGIGWRSITKPDHPVGPGGRAARVRELGGKAITSSPTKVRAISDELAPRKTRSGHESHDRLAHHVIGASRQCEHCSRDCSLSLGTDHPRACTQLD